MFSYLVFFFNDTATTEIYTLSLHDALPICRDRRSRAEERRQHRQVEHQHLRVGDVGQEALYPTGTRSEEHTSELQSRQYLVCRLLLEKKKKNYKLPSKSRTFNSEHNIRSLS